MANFLEGLWGLVKHPVDEAKWMWDETKNVGKPLLKGDLGESFDQFKGTFGRHQDMMSENITVPLGGRNKLTENSDAVAGAIVGGILAAPMMAGGGAAAGGSAGGTAGGGMSGAGLGWQGGAQMGALSPSFTPTTAFGGAGAGGTTGGTGAMGMSTAYTPTTAFGQAAASGGASTPAASSGFDFAKFAQMTKNLQAPEEQQQGVSMGAPTGGRWSGFDRKLYQNPALEQEYAKVYMQPTYRKLV